MMTMSSFLHCQTIAHTAFTLTVRALLPPYRSWWSCLLPPTSAQSDVAPPDDLTNLHILFAKNVILLHRYANNLTRWPLFYLRPKIKSANAKNSQNVAVCCQFGSPWSIIFCRRGATRRFAPPRGKKAMPQPRPRQVSSRLSLPLPRWVEEAPGHRCGCYGGTGNSPSSSCCRPKDPTAAATMAPAWWRASGEGESRAQKLCSMIDKNSFYFFVLHLIIVLVL